MLVIEVERESSGKKYRDISENRKSHNLKEKVLPQGLIIPPGKARGPCIATTVSTNLLE